ncbi:MAG: hypothetical protein AAF337_04685 [Pseudomonadota bacterium]
MHRFAFEDIAGQSDEDVLLKVGQGNWRAVSVTGFPVERFLDAAVQWKAALQGVDKPWLVWCTHPDWAHVQQRLVEDAGWTPIVGNDPRATDIPLTKSAVRIDFNAGLDLPVLYPHVPLEFAFAWAPKLAFWHSDLLLRQADMHALAQRFEALEDGATIAVKPAEGRRVLLTPRKRRYWELIGCTTAAASADQWRAGAGWMGNFYMHPNCPSAEERVRRKRYYYDHGAGIRFWHKECGGRVELIEEAAVSYGHFTKIGNPDYSRTVPHNSSDAGRDMREEITRNFDLQRIVEDLDLTALL